MRGKYKQKQIKRFFSFSDYCIDTFKMKTYKLSLDAGFSCPNRDGKIDTRGCIFCSAGGSGEFAERLTCSNLDKAVEDAKLKVATKVPNECGYIAYFQNYTNTYADASELEKIFLPVILRDDILAISIATRPDCLPPAVIDLIARLNAIKPVFVELGLQTIHPQTARFIRRGYDLEVFDKGVEDLKSTGAKITVHLIIGLPNESEEMIVQSVRYIASKGVHGVKFHLLHFLENTDLASLYRDGKINALSMEEYTYLLSKCILALPKDIVVHRITGDAPKNLLIAPLWSANKKAVLNYITKYFNEHDIIQGKDAYN